MIKVTVLFFAGLRDAFGAAEMQRTLPPGASLSQLIEALFQGRKDKFAQLKSVRFGVNQDFAPIDTLLQDGDEVALLPPLAGG